MKNRLIKRITASMLLIILSAIVVSTTFAEITDFDGGLTGNPLIKASNYEYKEITFITGKPVILEGTVAITIGDKTKPTYNMTYAYSLKNTAEGMTMTRKAAYEVVKTKDEGVNQTTSKFNLTSLSESYSAGGDTYTTDGSRTFEKSALYDNTPMVDYMSGSLYIKRELYRNGTFESNKGKVTIESSSEDNVGYSHKWGNSESMVVKQDYTYEIGAVKSFGTAKIKLSTLDKSTFSYNITRPQNISFKGNYIQKLMRDTVLSYTYDMPGVGIGAAGEARRSKGGSSLKNTILLGTKSLIAPKARDIYGATGEGSMIFDLSIKLFDDARYFSPTVKITRKDFSMALVKAMADITPLTPADIIKRARPGVEKIIKYSDLKQDDPNIVYFEFLQTKGVITGEGKYFYPDRFITRQEAVNMMIKALGLTSMAPTPPYKTAYKDDKNIGYWAKDSVYAAYEIGLETGYGDKTFKPRSTMTRAEASIMLKKYIDHVRLVINSDYREKILN